MNCYDGQISTLPGYRSILLLNGSIMACITLGPCKFKRHHQTAKMSELELLSKCTFYFAAFSSRHEALHGVFYAQGRKNAGLTLGKKGGHYSEAPLEGNSESG